MRKNTASQHVSFQAVSTTDGSAVTTGTPTVYYCIDGGTQATGSGTCTHEGNGCWDYVPDTAETNGDHVSFTFSLSGAINQTVNLYPVSFDPTASDMGLNDLSASEVNAEVDTALADIHLDHLLAVDYDPASKPGTATALLNELVEDDSGVSRFTVNALENGPSGSGASAAAIADAVWDEAQSGHTTAGTFGEIATEIADILADTNELQSDWVNGGRLDNILDSRSSQSSVDTIDSEVGLMQTDVTAILVDTGTDIPNLITALNDLSAADVNAEVDTALADIHLDHLFATAYDATSKPGAADALLNEMVEDDSGVTRYTVNALENGPSGSGASASAIADAVWDEAQSGHTTAGTFGEIATEIASILTDTSTTLDDALSIIDSNVDSIVTTVGAINTNLGSPEGNDVATDVASILSNTSSIASAATIADAVWDEAQSGHTSAGSFGEIATEIAAILVDTGTTLPATLTTIDNEIATIDGIVDDILVDTATTIPALIGTPINDLADDMLAFTQLMTRKDSDVYSGRSTELAAINGTPGTGFFDSRTDSVEAMQAYLPSISGSVTATIPNLINGLNDPTAAAVADAVWDEVQSGHTTAGTFGRYLDGAISSISTSASPTLLQTTTIATLASQTSFTLTAGSADDDAYNDATAIITDSATSTQKCFATISDYTGSTRTVTLQSDPGVFTMAAGDTISIVVSGTGSGGSNSGAGAITHTFTVRDDGDPVDGAEVWVTTDLAGNNLVAGTLTSDGLGQVEFMLDAGTYYAWVQKNKVNFTNPTSFTVSS